jgi:hypothetical protein
MPLDRHDAGIHLLTIPLSSPIAELAESPDEAFPTSLLKNDMVGGVGRDLRRDTVLRTTEVSDLSRADWST